MNTKLLKELKNQLPKRYTSTLSNECGVSPAIVSKVLSGKITDHNGVIDAALRLRNKHQRDLKRKEKKLKNELKK
jgi:hypothetical protein